MGDVYVLVALKFTQRAGALEAEARTAVISFPVPKSTLARR